MLEVAPVSPSSIEIRHPQIAEIRCFDSVEATASAAASMMLDIVKNTPSAVITYATGETMRPLYRQLPVAAEHQHVKFSGTYAFHLDERYPLKDRFDDTSFAQFVDSRFFMPLDIPLDHRMLWNGLAQDPEAEVKRYNTLLTQHPVDIAILGIGTDSHVAFNMPGTPFEQECHYVPKLAEAVLRRDRIERGEDVPDGALTQGIANIVRAKKIILLAYGTQKGIALRNSLYGDISTEFPASALRLAGEKVHIYVDQPAAAEILAPV